MDDLSIIAEQIWFCLGQESLDDEAFNSLALRIFETQYRLIPPYRTLCQSLGVDPDRVAHYSQIPPVSSQSFRSLDFALWEPIRAQRVFLSSGTTAGPDRRSRHFVFDLSLYRRSVLNWFVPHLIPEQRPLPIAVLFPSPQELPHSSLAEMLATVVAHFAANQQGAWFASGGQLLFGELVDWLKKEEKKDEPILLLGTTLSFAAFLDGCDAEGLTLQLPPGSRLMDTGGSKGVHRSYPLPQMRLRYDRSLGIRPEFCINEYGMAELLSQFYDGKIGQPYIGADNLPRDPTVPERFHKGPPWTRSRVVDPITLEDVPVGSAGILLHYDLANWQTALAVLTEDVAIAAASGFYLIGRSGSSEVRGCSLLMEELTVSFGCDRMAHPQLLDQEA